MSSRASATRIANDVLVPVPVQRSRTRIRDGVIDALAMVGAWWRVVAGRRKPADMPAWSVHAVPALPLVVLFFIAGDILRTASVPGAPTPCSNYTHVWYLSDQIFHHGTLPLHVLLLDNGKRDDVPVRHPAVPGGALCLSRCSATGR